MAQEEAEADEVVAVDDEVEQTAAEVEQDQAASASSAAEEELDSYEKCEAVELPEAQKSTETVSTSKLECETNLQQAESTVGTKEENAKSKHESLKKVIVQLQSQSAEEKKARTVAFVAVKARHDQIAQCTSRINTAKELHAAAKVALDARLKIALNELKTQEGELQAQLQQDLASKRAAVSSEVAAQEQQATTAADAAESQAEALSEQAVQEKQSELEAETSAAVQDVSASEAQDASLEEQISTVTNEHTEAVEALTADIAKLREQNADLEARISTAKSNVELDLAKRKETANMEATFRQWGQKAAVDVQDAAIDLDKAQSESQEGVEAKRLAAEKLLATLNQVVP